MKKIIERYGLMLFRIALVIVAIVFMIIGIGREEQMITMMRAIYICLECIGIG